jgi:hypothetical protein
MTLSRHSQVENLSGLLNSRRTGRRQQIRRQAAYLSLVGAILDRPAAEIELTSPISSLNLPITALPAQSQAA